MSCIFYRYWELPSFREGSLGIQIHTYFWLFGVKQLLRNRVGRLGIEIFVLSLGLLWAGL